MARDYNEFLAVSVLNDQQLVSYRTLSRALQIHSNKAKQMLYEFHRKQNAKKPGSVHATYLLTGTRRPQTASQTNGVHSQETNGDDQDGDTVMQSSPPLPGSSAPEPAEETEETPPARTIMLVKEEQLDQAKAALETLTSIHIYSLEATTLPNLEVLSECNRRIAADDVLAGAPTNPLPYGAIRNQHAKRRAPRTAPPHAPATEPTKPAAGASSKAATATAKQEKPAPTDSPKQPTTKTTTSDADLPTKPGPQHKSAASSIFASFAKTQPPKPKAAGTTATKSAPQQEDAPMPDFSSDDGDGSDADEGDGEKDPGAAAQAAAKTSAAGAARSERKKELQDMMDVEDQEENEGTDEAMGDPPTGAEDGDAEALDAPAAQGAEAEAGETAQVVGGRRRGRRRVMKKKTGKDEDGYLVTREEAAWESFSEDEAPQQPALKKAKPSGGAVGGGGAGAKGAPGKKGAAGKAGQGNIMKFFGKK